MLLLLFSSSLFFKSKLDWFATSFSPTCYFYYQLRSIQIRHEKILQCWELNIKKPTEIFHQLVLFALGK